MKKLITVGLVILASSCGENISVKMGDNPIGKVLPSNTCVQGGQYGYIIYEEDGTYAYLSALNSSGIPTVLTEKIYIHDTIYLTQIPCPQITPSNTQ